MSRGFGRMIMTYGGREIPIAPTVMRKLMAVAPEALVEAVVESLFERLDAEQKPAPTDSPKERLLAEEEEAQWAFKQRLHGEAKFGHNQIAAVCRDVLTSMSLPLVDYVIYDYASRIYNGPRNEQAVREHFTAYIRRITGQA